MEKRIKITALCGMGLGTSSLARMAIMDYVRSHGINAEVTVADIGSVRGLNSDIIITTKSMSSHITDDIKQRTTVIYVTNLIKKDEISEKLDEYFSEHK
ncbi:MAG: PTS sugar transporter subunit IIB [Olsenella sp.]|jgi:PTS system ascorbate-specific IIB component|nr:PTS sugar transporter subunit IIB [Olsenella sp.]